MYAYDTAGLERKIYGAKMKWKQKAVGNVSSNHLII